MVKSLGLFGCVHVGEDAHDAEELQRYIDYAHKHKSTFELAFLGDLFDTGVPVGTKHVGSVFNNDKSPQEQMDYFIDKFEDLAPQTVAFVKGNHERRVEDVTSIEMVKIVADRMKVPYKGASGVFVWNNKKIFVAHGASSGPMTDYNKIIQAYEGLDVIVLAHSHQMYTQKLRRFVVNAQGNVSEKEIHLVRTGSFLKDAKYAKFALHPPTPIGASILEYDTETRQLNVRLGL